MYMGYLRGFIRDFADLLALIIAISLSIAGYIKVGAWLMNVVSLSSGLANTIGFFVIWFVVMLVYYGLMVFFYDRVPEHVRISKPNRWLGIVPAFVRAVFFVWFTVNLISLVAVSGPLKSAFDDSMISRNLTKSNALVSDFVNKTFGPGVADIADFLTIKPQSDELIQLGFSTENVSVDTASSEEMLLLINKERTARGLDELVLDDKLTKVGEAHSRDMFARGYFSHNTPEGKTPFDRMDEANIRYLIAGENLALAPTVDDAFTGLMNSPGHKANMLSSDFGKVGIGVIDGGKYGLMFAQEFTN